MTQFQAKNHYLLIKPETMTKLENGMVIPPSIDSKSFFQLGEVLSVGEEIDNIKPGDIIVYDKRSGMTFEKNSETFQFIAKADVYGVKQ